MGNLILVEPDTELIRDVMEAGGGDLKKCFQCATCAATCSLSSEESTFPRKQMLLAQWGMKKELLKDPRPGNASIAASARRRVPGRPTPARP